MEFKVGKETPRLLCVLELKHTDLTGSHLRTRMGFAKVTANWAKVVKEEKNQVDFGNNKLVSLVSTHKESSTRYPLVSIYKPKQEAQTPPQSFPKARQS